MGDVSLTPSFVFQIEKRMKNFQENEYARMLLEENIWWTKVSKQITSDGASERFTWFLNTAEIYPVGDGGNIPFDPLVTQSTELVPQRYASGIKVKKDALLDLRGGGLDILADWSMQIGAKTAYFPQRLLTEMILNGSATNGSANAYDGVQYFADNLTSNTFSGIAVTGHPYNPYNPYVGGYANWLHGAATTYTQPSGATIQYPGALPIDESVTIDVALKNLGKLFAYVSSFKMPDGITPRFLKRGFLMGPPALTPRLQELTGAYFIPQGATGGAGSADVRRIITKWGLKEPVEAAELASSTSYTAQIMQAAQTATGQASGIKTLYKQAIAGSDTTYYLVLEQAMSSQLGSMVHMMREPFKTNYFFGEGSTGATGIDAILNRALEIEYICQGRMSQQLGHPYGMLRIDNA